MQSRDLCFVICHCCGGYRLHIAREQGVLQKSPKVGVYNERTGGDSHFAEDKYFAEAIELRQRKSLNNIVEQDHRFLKCKVKPGLRFASFNTARRTIRGYEVMNMIRKGQQVNGFEKGDVMGQLSFIHQIFGVAV